MTEGFLVPAPLFSALRSYLGTCPHDETRGLIDAMQAQCTPAKTAAPAAAPTNGRIPTPEELAKLREQERKDARPTGGLEGADRQDDRLRDRGDGRSRGSADVAEPAE